MMDSEKKIIGDETGYYQIIIWINIINLESW